MWLVSLVAFASVVVSRFAVNFCWLYKAFSFPCFGQNFKTACSMFAYLLKRVDEIFTTKNCSFASSAFATKY